VLKQRIITALLLVGLILGTLTASQLWPFAVLTLALMSAAAWEWGRLNQSGTALSWLLGGMLGLGGVLVLQSPFANQAPSALWWSASALWALLAFVALRSGPALWTTLPRGTRWLIGVAALFFAWLALAHARVLGINFMLSMLCLVWMADVCAYFGGRAWGRRKLAPSISPGKSWEGVWAGVCGVWLLAVLWMALDGHFSFDSASLYTRLWQAWGWLGMALALVVLCGFSVIGDLMESLVKRAAGAKDSSRLLPGHGGVLDRVDALLPVMPLALALATLAKP